MIRKRPHPFDEGRAYFAYGSNLSLAGMQVRAPSAGRVTTATLDGWQLTFRGVADIEPAEGQKVTGALYDMTPEAWWSIDGYEGAPFLYQRRSIVVEQADGLSVEALAYVMTGAPRDLGAPCPSYLRSIADGYSDWSLPITTLEAAVRRAGGGPALLACLRA